MVIIKLINNRYKLEELVYSNLYCSTYIGLDLSQNDKRVMINVLNNDNIKKKFIANMVDEFIKITSVEHQNIQKCLRFDVIDTIDTKVITNKQYYFTTEFIDMVDTVDLKELSFDNKLQIFKDLCYAIQYLHFRGYTYRSLSFENFLVYIKDNQYRVKLENIVSAKLYSNRPEYNNQFKAPEVISGEGFGYSADIYSLGVILFYLITGKDYKVTNFKSCIGNRYGEVYKVINKMTRFETDDRYDNILDVMKDLKEIFEVDYEFVDKEYYEVLHFKQPLVSRDKEIKTIYDQISEYRTKQPYPSIMLLYGESGVGKTRLLKEIEYKLRVNKSKTISNTLTQEEEEDFSLFKDVVSHTIKNMQPEIDLITRYGSELVKIVPEITERWDISPSDPLNMEKENFRLINRIASYLLDLSVRQELIIAIDDINYLNKFDRKIMEVILSGKKVGNIVFIATQSIVDDNDKICSFKSIATLFSSLNVTKLNIDEMTIFVQNILGLDKKPIKFTTKIMELADGTPKYIEEIVRCLYVNHRLYIAEDRIWKIDIDNMDELELPDSISDAIKNTLDCLEDQDNEILSLISVFKSSVPKNILEEIIGFDKMTMLNHLNKLMKLNIITEKLDDWGYNYGFYDDRLKKYYYKEIIEGKVEAHKKVAQYLENCLNSKGDYTTELIYHYVNSNNYSKAIDYSIKAGEKMECLYINKQAIVFYEEALKLLEDVEDKELQCNILLNVASLYLKNGETYKAYEKYMMTRDIAKKVNLLAQYITSLNKLASIEMFMGDKANAKHNIHEAYKLAIKHDYIEGELESALQQCYLLPMINEEISMRKFIGKYIAISIEHEMYYYTASLYNALGLRYINKNKMEESMEFFLESIRYFDMSDFVIDKVKPINNLGVVYINCYKDIEKGREYFNKSLKLYDNFNHSIGKPLVLANLGELASIEDDYLSALDYYNKALQLANDIGDVQQLYVCYVNLSTLYTKMYKYDKASYYIKKAEDFRNQVLDDDQYFFEYCYSHIMYHLQIHDLEEAEEWLDTLKEREGLNSEEIVQTVIADLRLRIYKSDIVDEDKMIHLLYEHLDTANPKHIRDFIKHLIKYFISVEKFDKVYELNQLDNKLEAQFDTHLIDIKKAFVLGKLTSNKIDYYKEIIANIDNEYLDEYKWRAHKILGDEYLNEEDYYNALSNYVTALDILKNITIKIPKHLRHNYIFRYKNHYDLRAIINKIKNIILGIDTDEVKVYDNVMDFFDISDFDQLFNNKEFMKSGLREREPSRYHYNDIYDLITNVNGDGMFVIKQILSYCADVTLAERGFVIINNEDERNIINFNNKNIDREVDSIINSANHDGLARSRSNREQADLDNYFMSNIKSYICIPLNKHRNVEIDGYRDDDAERRKSVGYFDEIIGYLYLDTYKVFNNFTDDTIRECKQIANLLSLVINNYNLKMSSSIDKLTGVYLRKYIEDVFNKQLGYANDNKVKLSIVMSDIDKFKLINDTYGHVKGDEVLKGISKIFQDNIRKTDYVGRYGGEEFILLLPNTDALGAYTLCDKLGKLIAEADFMNNNKQVTMSFGISTYPDNGTHEEMLIERADKALYHSKETGRNKTSIWNTELDMYSDGFDSGLIGLSFGGDYRKTDILLNIMKILSRHEDKSMRVYDMLGYILELTEASECMLIEFDEDNSIKSSKSRKSGLIDWYDGYDINSNIIKEYANKTKGDFFIDWNNISEEYNGVLPNWKSFIVVPLYLHGVKKGLIILSVPISEKEFDLKTYNLINSLNGIIASML